jgi:hypothetical protein
MVLRVVSKLYLTASNDERKLSAFVDAGALLRPMPLHLVDGSEATRLVDIFPSFCENVPWITA